MEDQEKDEKEEQGTEEFESTGSWLRDNLRIIISIVIVVAIAGGVYSYSKRSQVATDKSGQVAIEETEDNQTEVDVQKDDEGAASKRDQQKPADQKKQAPATTSQETERSFVETAGRGDGQTHLARRALANYLEKNPDSSLTPEHKIYIEDYLRKNSGFRGRVFVGTSVEFSKDLVNKAIGSSKTLSDKQLQNLHKFAVRVPSLS